jgi:hypothetical protein
MKAETADRNYGHGAAIAFTTYKSEVCRRYAEQVWWAVKAFTLGRHEQGYSLPEEFHHEPNLRRQ